MQITVDWKNPDYAPIYLERARRLEELRADPKLLRDVKLYYKHHPVDFITDWGMTIDPRNLERNLPAAIPFVLFPKQVEWLHFILRKWREGKPGITEKSRDMGISWLAISLSCTLCLFHDNMQIGFGSRKEEYVDLAGSPKSLFYRARFFMKWLPEEFRGNWDEKKHAPHMRIIFPESGSIMTGEAGDNIGRGDRAAIYFVDEAAFLGRPTLIEASLSNTTNCRQDMSSVNGTDNPFAQKRYGGKIEVFTFNWRDDPRKDDAWYAAKCDELDPVVVAREIDINYGASVGNVVIPNEWIQCAIDAHKKLNIDPTGHSMGSFDVADTGRDKCAWGYNKGILLEHADDWSGADDIFASVEKVFLLQEEFGLGSFCYDADGMGASVRGDSRVVNERRMKDNALKPPQEQVREIVTIPFRGSASGEALYMPESRVLGPNGLPTDRKNKDFFANYKAQSWWSLRYRFQQTYRAVVRGMSYDPDAIISISSEIPKLAKLCMELGQPRYLINGTGKLLIDKTPDGVASPNLADMVMMLYAPRRAALVISDELLQSV